MEHLRVARGRTLLGVSTQSLGGFPTQALSAWLRKSPSAEAWRSSRLSTDGPAVLVGRGAKVHTILHLTLNAADNTVTRSAVGRLEKNSRTDAVIAASDFLHFGLMGSLTVYTKVGSLAYILGGGGARRCLGAGLVVVVPALVVVGWVVVGADGAG